MSFKVQTKGHYDFINITEKIITEASKFSVQDGIALIFIPNTTAAVTIVEYEEGIIKDMINVFEKIAPEHADYEHHKRWHDHNGAAHIKAALVGPDLVVPIENGKLKLGQWQSIVLIDFDERPREREVVVKIINSLSF